ASGACRRSSRPRYPVPPVISRRWRPPTSPPGAARQRPHETRHLDRRLGGLDALVAPRPSGAVERLLLGVAREKAEADRAPRVERRLDDAPGCLGADVLEVRSL